LVKLHQILLASWPRRYCSPQYPSVSEAPAPLLLSNCIDQRLQHQALYGIEPLDWLMRRAYTKSPRKLATRRDVADLKGSCVLRTLLDKCHNYSGRSLRSWWTWHGPRWNLSSYVTKNGNRGHMASHMMLYMVYAVYTRDAYV